MRRVSVNIGDEVELHNQFDDTWSRGFEITAVIDGGYRVRRIHDGQLLPDPTGHADVRPASRPYG